MKINRTDDVETRKALVFHLLDELEEALQKGDFVLFPDERYNLIQILNDYARGISITYDDHAPYSDLIYLGDKIEDLSEEINYLSSQIK